MTAAKRRRHLGDVGRNMQRARVCPPVTQGGVADADKGAGLAVACTAPGTVQTPCAHSPQDMAKTGRVILR